jgi:mono/diheme cytochrome c family protein
MPAKTPATEEAAMLKPFLLFSAVVIIAIIPASAPTFAVGRPPQDAAPASTNPVKPTAASQEKAKKLYSQDCAMCHGDNGNGKTDLASSMQLTLADWTDPKSLGSKSDQELFDIIRKGKGDKMPPEDASRAKDADVWGLITYIRALSKNQPAASAPPAAAPAGAAPGK